MRFQLSVLIGLLLHFLNACGGDVEDVSSPSESITEIQSGLYIGKPYLWPSRVIPVCWEIQNAPSEADMASVQNAVTAAYESASGVHFTGWNYCASLSSKFGGGVRIVNVDSRPRVYGFGTQNANIANNMNLNFVMTNWNSSCLDTPTHRDSCIRSVAVHEFGHVLSAYHEQYRPDVWSQCHNWLVDTGQDLTVISGPDANSIYAPTGGSFDIHSVMNYCNNGNFIYQGVDYTSKYGLIYNNNGVLSMNDLLGFQPFYGSNKMAVETGTGEGPLASGVKGVLFTPKNSLNIYAKPDLYNIAYGTSGSGTVEIHALSGSSNYQNWIVHSTSALPLVANSNLTYGFDLADFDGDNIPDLFFFYNNATTGYQEAHVLGGSSGWQNYILHAQLPLASAPDYKFAFGDYDGDGRPDLFAVRPRDNTTISVFVLSGGSSYLKFSVKTFAALPNPADSVARCHFVTGNFYNNINDPKTDLICMSMDPKSQSASVGILALKAKENFNFARQVNSTQIVAADGTHSDFGVWQVGPTDSGGGWYGTNMYIGHIAETGRPTTEIHFMNAMLYF